MVSTAYNHFALRFAFALCVALGVAADGAQLAPQSVTRTTRARGTAQASVPTPLPPAGLLGRLQGIWRGHGTKNAVPWTIVVTISGTAYSIEYPSFPCGGLLTLDTVSDTVATFDEAISDGSCTAGVVSLSTVSADTIQFTWSHTSGAVGMQAQLRNAANATAPAGAAAPSPSPSHPPAVAGNRRPNGAPSHAEIQACLSTTKDERARGYGQIRSLQYGTPMTSQGGLLELSLGAPKGTVIYPIKLSFGPNSYNNWVLWAFLDSFGELTCSRQ